MQKKGDEIYVCQKFRKWEYLIIPIWILSSANIPNVRKEVVEHLIINQLYKFVLLWNCLLHDTICTKTHREYSDDAETTKYELRSMNQEVLIKKC